MDSAPTAPSPASSCTASALRSKTTHSWPSRMRRRTMLAPIRPSPIIPSCTGQGSFPRPRGAQVVLVSGGGVTSGARAAHDPPCDQQDDDHADQGAHDPAPVEYVGIA